MSRSIKKTPVCKEQASRWIKRQASKAVRRYPHDISFGKSYRKIFLLGISVIGGSTHRTKRQLMSGKLLTRLGVNR